VAGPEPIEGLAMIQLPLLKNANIVPKATRAKMISKDFLKVLILIDSYFFDRFFERNGKSTKKNVVCQAVGVKKKAILVESP
jgi:hypothetical protein